MSNEKAREMLTLLDRLGQAELGEEQMHQVQDDVQAALLPLVGPNHADRLEYASWEVDWLGLGPKTIQGLSVGASGLLLTEIVDQLRAVDDESLATLGAPHGLEPGQVRAALHAIYWILNALEWESRDATVDPEYPPEQREIMLAARLRSLDCFRTTGEP